MICLIKMKAKVVPDKMFTFPTKAIGGKLRSCAHHWFQDYSWLEYSVEKDAMFCKPCRHFSRASKSGDHDGVFTLAGFSNWKKINEKLEKHQGSNVHTDSVGNQCHRTPLNLTYLVQSLNSSQVKLTLSYES